MDKHYIVLNGKRYDAVTGALLGPDKAVHVSVSSQRQAAVHAVQRAHHAPQAATKPRTHHLDLSNAKPDRSHHQKQAVKVAVRKPQPAKTLMRRSVLKPEHKDKPTLKQQYPLVKTSSGITVHAPKRLAHNVDDSRAKRAQQIHKSTHIGRYQATALAPIKAKVTELSVAEPKALLPSHQSAVKISVRDNNSNQQQQHHKVAQAPVRQAKKIDVFEQAIASATAHEELAPYRASKRRRFASMTAGVATVLVLGGFIVALNQSQVEMQIASARAGFKANIPTYAPDGFQKKGAEVAGKAIEISYGSINGNYTLTQESSSWDSQTLFDSITARPNTAYEIIHNNGKTIYRYNTTQVAWVDGGILYRIVDNANLTADEIIAIASSF